MQLFKSSLFLTVETLSDGGSDILPDLVKPEVGGLPCLLYYHLPNSE